MWTSPPLLVLHHGNNAGPEDWHSFEAAARRRAPNLRVLRAASNAHDTHGGIALLGRRCADEVARFLVGALSEAQRGDHGNCATPEYCCQDGTALKLPLTVDLPELYVVGHSLGGLVLRWCLGHLHACGALACVAPRVYMSIGTPHLGVRAPGWSLWRSWINFAAVVGITERELVMDDGGRGSGAGGSPLLASLADPRGDAARALALFSTRVAAGLSTEMLVPAPSACVCADAERAAEAAAAAAGEEERRWSAVTADEAFAPPPASCPRVEQRWGWPRDAAGGWLTASPDAANLPLQLLDRLCALRWERVLIRAPDSLLMRKTAHDFPVAKGQRACDEGAALECVEMLAGLLLIRRTYRA